MKTKEMICELRRLEEAHKDDFVGTGETNWSLMCYDVANRLEELLKAQETAVDAVPVIRCRDCKHSIENAKHLDMACERSYDPDFYCAAGERKESE